MSVSLYVRNSFNATINNCPLQGYQGTSGFDDPATITLAGKSKIVPSSLASGGSFLVYDDSVDTEVVDIMHLWVKSDQAFYLQLITAATEVRIGPLAANVPHSLSAYATLKLLASAGTTAMSTVEPVTADVKKILLGNFSGSTMNYLFGVFL
jgi:hypothetical protein